MDLKAKKAPLTVSVVDMEETLWKLALETDDCLLSTESLKEDSLCDTDMQSLLDAWDRKCKQGTFSARVSLLINDDLSAKLIHSVSSLGYWLVVWLHSPIFRVNDGVDKGIVDGRSLCYNCRDCFGIRVEDASISARSKAFVKSTTVAILLLTSDPIA